MATQRDAHFKQAAAALFVEMMRAKTREEIELLFARRLYDLAHHTLESTGYGFDLWNIGSNIADNVPDITTWEEGK